MSEKSDHIRKWLLRAPRPDSVTVNLRDGDAQDISTVGNIRWRDIAETIEALDPESIHAMKGTQLLRAERFDAVEPAAALAKPEPAKPHVVPGMPMLPPELAGDPATALFAYYAALIDRSYQFAIGTSNATMLSVIELMNKRSEAIEQRLERTERNLQSEMADRYEEAWEQLQAQAEAQESEGGGGNAKDAILAAFMQGQTMRANGAAKPKAKS